jgi:hypothetical protein
LAPPSFLIGVCHIFPYLKWPVFRCPYLAGFGCPLTILAKLPNADKAIIETEKLRDYILSATHPVGRFKAAYFLRFGYSTVNWEVFERDLRSLIADIDVSEIQESRYGKKFVIKGSVISPSGVPVQIVTAWIILKGESVPLFVTAFPGE